MMAILSRPQCVKQESYVCFVGSYGSYQNMVQFNSMSPGCGSKYGVTYIRCLTSVFHSSLSLCKNKCANNEVKKGLSSITHDQIWPQIMQDIWVHFLEAQNNKNTWTYIQQGSNLLLNILLVRLKKTELINRVNFLTNHCLQRLFEKHFRQKINQVQYFPGNMLMVCVLLLFGTSQFDPSVRVS